MPKANANKKTVAAPAPYSGPGAAVVKKEKKAAPAAKKSTAGDAFAALYEKKTHHYGPGGAPRPKGRDLTRVIKMPKYVRVARQKKILLQRFKVPPTINQFRNTLDKTLSVSLFKLLHKYRPETKKEKSDRLKAIAAARKEATEASKASKAGQEPKEAKESKEAKPVHKRPTGANKEAVVTPRPAVAHFGLNHVTSLIESKKAKLVVIAADVEPIELVCWIPALCNKLDIPYCIVNGRARLGTVVHQKTASVLAITEVRAEDADDLAKLSTAIRAVYNDKYEETRKTWGGRLLSKKSQMEIARRKAIATAEAAKKAAGVRGALRAEGEMASGVLA